jgi:hypothetical protein
MAKVAAVAEVQTPTDARALLATHRAVVIRAALATDVCARWSAGVLAARTDWTEDFGGEQFSLGRAFYTHYETDQSGRYFADAAGSDARVERHAPGLQSTMQRLLAEAVSGRAVPRPGWCGAGVHVFPAGGALAAQGGVVHFDTEGLTEAHVERTRPALSLVVMLQPAERGGGLRLWPVVCPGKRGPDEASLRRGTPTTVVCGAGDAVLFDSYRLHQIRPFEGERHRLSATLHGAEIDRDLWETWF